MVFQLGSTVFDYEGSIPDRFTCRGEETSPPLNWLDSPEGTKSFAIVMEDVDTPIGTITHWILYNIPFDKSELAESILQEEIFPDGMVQGRNGMRKNRYMGPCPPFGKHRYYFNIFALDTVLDPNPKVNKKKLLRQIEGHILGQAEIMGFYSKK